MSVPVSKFCNSNKAPAVKKFAQKYIAMKRQKEKYLVSKEYLKLVKRI